MEKEFPIRLTEKSFAQRKKTALSKADLSRKGLALTKIFFDCTVLVRL